VNGTMTEYSIPQSGDLLPSGIAIDTSGRVWFNLAGTDSVGYYYEGNFTIQNLTGAISTPVGITVDPSGNVWITQHGPSFISELNSKAQLLQTISTSNNSLTDSLPYFIHSDAEGNIWFNEHYGNSMGEFIPSNDTLVEYFIPSRAGADVGNISYALTSTVSSVGTPWFTEFFTGKVGTVNTSQPLGVSITVQNYSEPHASLANGSSLSLGLSISSHDQSVTLHGYVGNFTDQGNFTFGFSPVSQNGNFDSVVTIKNDGALPGTYLMTITAHTTNVAVSKAIEITVP